MGTNHFRLFVAIQVPEVIKAELQRIQSALRATIPAGAVRWTGPDQMHLTLRFLGNVSIGKVEALEQALHEVGFEYDPLNLRAASVGFFPNARAPRVIWVAVEDLSGQLTGLHQKVQHATAAFTNEPLEDKFVGHLTLGRIKFLKRSEAQALCQNAGALADHTFGEWTAGSLELIRSELTPSGANYTTLAEISLRRA